MMMSKTIPIYLGLACLVLESFVGLVVLLGASETQHAASEITTPLSIVAMPTTGRLLFHIPAIDDVVAGPENKNDFANTDTTIDGITDPLAALELNTEDGGEVHTPVTPADFPVVQARLNDEAEAEETPARIYMMDPPDQIPRVRQVLPLNDGFVVLRMPSDPLLVWEVDAVVLLETFLRDHAASVPVASDYDYKNEQQPMRQVLPMTPKERVVFRTPTDPWTTWSVDALALHVFLCDSGSAFGLDYDKYYEGATPDEDLQSTTSVHDDADEDAAANSNTEEPTAQADETCGDDDTNATESSLLRIAISRIAVYCFLGLFLTWDGFLTKPEWHKQEQPAPQPREVKPYFFLDPITPGYTKPVEERRRGLLEPHPTVQQRDPINAAPVWKRQRKPRPPGPMLHEYQGRYPGYDRYRDPFLQNRRSRSLFQ